MAYGASVCEEWCRRGSPDTCLEQMLHEVGIDASRWQGELRLAGALPPWLGRRPVHRCTNRRSCASSPSGTGQCSPTCPTTSPTCGPSRPATGAAADDAGAGDPARGGRASRRALHDGVPLRAHGAAPSYRARRRPLAGRPDRARTPRRPTVASPSAGTLAHFGMRRRCPSRILLQGRATRGCCGGGPNGGGPESAIAATGHRSLRQQRGRIGIGGGS